MSIWRPRITDNSPRLFTNDILELLSRTHPAVVVLLYLPVSAYAAWVKSWQRHHLLHHHQDKYDRRHFAISLPLWDKLFRTLGPS